VNNLDLHFEIRETVDDAVNAIGVVALKPDDDGELRDLTLFEVVDTLLRYYTEGVELRRVGSGPVPSLLVLAYSVGTPST
jgi:hypothetical protein